jgi:hypothetical protein
MAAATYRYCQAGLGLNWPPTFRRCLESAHDAVMGGINADFWKVVGAGS